MSILYRYKLNRYNGARLLSDFKNYAREHYPVVSEYGDGQETFLLTKDAALDKEDAYYKYFVPLAINGLVDAIPYDEQNLLIIFNDTADDIAFQDTVSPTHIRLPKDDHLLLLTPEDFFDLLTLIGKAKFNSSKNGLYLTPTIINYSTVEETPFAKFFVKKKVAYKTDPRIVNRVWTPFAAIQKMMVFPPTAENQLYSLQYFTVMRNIDYPLFPVSTLIELEIDDWEQLSPTYCRPPSLAQKKESKYTF